MQFFRYLLYPSQLYILQPHRQPYYNQVQQRGNNPTRPWNATQYRNTIGKIMEWPHHRNRPSNKKNSNPNSKKHTEQ